MNGLKKLAIISTHPVQYNAPLFKLLHERGNIGVKVFYTWGDSVLESKYDPGFGKVIEWDIPLLQGYDYEFLENRSKDKGSHHFRGIDNPRIIGDIKAYAPDAILLYGWAFRAHLRVLRFFHGKIPIFFRGDSTLLDDQPGLKSLIRRIFLSWVYSHIDKAFYVGKNNKEYFRKMGLPECKLVQALHSVNNGFFHDKEGLYEQRAQKWRSDLGISENALVFLFAGKMELKKSPSLLLDAFDKSAFPSETHLVMVGNGNLEARLKASFKKANIHFIDFQNQKLMPVVYRLGDVFVLPSGGPGETWGLALNEAMACGKPVIASTKCGGAIDLIKNGINGYIFEAGNKEDLERKMQLFLKDRKQIRKMGEAALEHIEKFSLLSLAKAIERSILS
jgi:glycosyltransferase involved in cell wall biosynthesis